MIILKLRFISSILLLLRLSRSVVSDSVRPHRRQPTRLPHPWGFPGKSTGVGAIAFSVSNPRHHLLMLCLLVNLILHRPSSTNSPTAIFQYHYIRILIKTEDPHAGAGGRGTHLPQRTHPYGEQFSLKTNWMLAERLFATKAVRKIQRGREER